MSTGTPTTPQTGVQPGLQPNEKAWLGRVLGSKVPWENKIKVGDSEPIDATKAIEDLKELKESLKLAESKLKEGESEENKKEFEELKAKVEGLGKALASVGIPSAAERGAAFDDDREAKDKALKQVRDLIELQKAEIASGTDYTVTVKRKKLPFKKEVKSKNKGDVSKEFSDVHHNERVVEGPTKEQLAALKLVIDQLIGLTEQIRTVGDSVLSPNELMEEIWTPLVRERIISEHQCPSEFSRVIQLWEGANALYKERCKEKAREEVEAYSEIRGGLDDLEKGIGIAASVIDVVLSALGTGAKSQEILKLVSKCARAGVNLISSALAKDLEGCSTQIGNVLAAAVPDPWGKVSQSAFMAVASSGLIAKKLSERDNDGAADLIGAALNNVFCIIGKSSGNDDTADLMERIGGHLEKGVNTLIKSKKIYDLLQEDPVNTKALMEAIGGLVESEVKRAMGEILKSQQDKATKAKETELKEKGLEEESEEYKKALEELKKEQEEESESWDGAMPIEELSKKMAGAMPGVPNMDELAQRCMEASAEQMNAELEAAQVSYSKSLGLVMGIGIGADDEDMALMADMYDIDKMIAQAEADRAQLELLNAILDAVGGVVSLVVPQLGGILKAKQFAMNVVAAVRRTQDLITFSSLVSDAKKGASPQAFALLAQVDELKHQLTSDTIDAAVNLGQALCLTGAAAADLSGIGAGAGAGLKLASGGLEAFAEAKDFLYEKFKERKVKRAWQRYRTALDNPEDRIAIVKAIRQNPTLAKYALAYGAIEMNDPFAKEALRQCNLNDAVLASENTNADKVVRYLETKFADDIQVVGVVSVFAPDSGDPLTLESWLKNKKAAKIADGKTMLAEAPPTNNIDAAFSAIKNSSMQVDSLDIDKAPDYVPWTTHTDNLNNLAKSLRSFKPLTTTNTAFDEFQDYLDELAFAVDVEAKRVVRQIDADKELKNTLNLSYTKTVSDCEEATKALEQTKNAIAKDLVTTPKADAVVLFCSKGGNAFELSNRLKVLSSNSPNLVDTSELVGQAIHFALRRANKLVASGGGSPVEVTEIVKPLVSELAEAEIAVKAIFTTTKSKITV